MKTRINFVILLALALILPVITIMVAAQAGTSANSGQARPEGPGDIYNAAGYPCVTAHSTTRALFSSYNGPLYQIKRQSDGETLDIGIIQPSANDAGGYADSAAQDKFCEGTTCFITTIYDQTGKGNHLVQAPPGTFVGPAKGGFNTLPIADMAPVTIMGHKVYGTYIMPGMGLRNNNASGLAINDEPQGIYMVFNGTHYDSGCCFNYGNTSTNSTAVGTGTMDTVYFGTATAWGSGEGPGPWIMSDMEAGLFSGYNAKQNVGSPTIDSWRFVTGSVNGGGGNQWEIRGGNAQGGELTTFYQGPRPGSNENNTYYPMHRKGAVQMGNGGDNGNGSAGTFYEGIITVGYPPENVTNLVQANIVAAKYNVQHISMSRVTTFTPKSSQDVTLTFTNTTEPYLAKGIVADNVKLSLEVPEGWTSVVSGTSDTSKTFTDTIAPGASVKATFKVTSPSTTAGGYINGKVEWTYITTTNTYSESTSQKVRNAFPVKINEVRLSTSSNPTNQFIELYNAYDSEVDISNWSIINTKSEWAPVKLATIPEGTKLAAKGFYLLGLSTTGLATPASEGATAINVLSTAGFEAGQKIDIGGETKTIKEVGTPASEMTTIFIPVSTGPWLTIPEGSTNIPVTNAAGFVVGQKIGIDIGGNYETATVTEVGKAATQTTLSTETKAGDTTIRLGSVSNITVGDTLTIDTGARKEVIKVKSISNIIATTTGSRGMGGRGFGGGRGGGGTPGEVELAAPLKFDHILSVDVSCPGTGISFSPATKFAHKSGEAVQALGIGITLDSDLAKSHEYGAPVINAQVTSAGYQGTPAPNQWFGGPLSASAGSIALMDNSGKVVVDAMVYGSQQSSSSANGTITSPEIAILEGDQSQGGCIVVVPSAGRGGFGRGGGAAGGETNKSLARYPNGKDTDSNCDDFRTQPAGTNLVFAVEAGAKNIITAGVTGLSEGQSMIIDSGDSRETLVIEKVGTGGGATISTATEVGATEIAIESISGFSIGQTIIIDSDENKETAIVSSISGGGRGAMGGRGNRGGFDFMPTVIVNRSSSGSAITLIVTSPLKKAHAAGAQISGTGITLKRALINSYNSGAIIGSSVPTPGMAN